MATAVWTDIINDLNRDIAIQAPQDVLQWASDWFQARLKRDRSSTLVHPSNGTRRGFPPNLTGFPPAMSAQFQAHQPSPFSENGPTDSPFAPRRATEPSTSTRNGAPMFASPFGNVVQSQGTSHMNDGISPSPDPGDPAVPSYVLGRRTSVSAESLVPTSQRKFTIAGGNMGVVDEDGGDEPVPVYPKTDEQMARIRTATKANFLFRNLDEEQEADVLAAMKEVRVGAGDLVIEQGAAGDYFYVVESGSLDVYIKRDGQVVDQAKGDHPTLGKKVASYVEGGAFGELALMHNAPRAASILSLTPCTLWALDRVSFKTILLDHTSRKRRLYESFLSEVPILASLQPQERAKIADVLESRAYADGQDVIVQGQSGEEFFLIESGEAVAIKRNAQGQEEVVKEMTKGDYFGELALLTKEPRAATVRAHGAEKLRVAALGEQAFTRLLGPVRDIMARSAGERYGVAVGL